jgi:hypothetical protein
MRKLLIIAGALWLVAAVPAAEKPSCDRNCLDKIADQYLDAVMAHDPSKAPIGKSAKFTENAQRLEVGDGLWNTATGKGTYTLHIDDPEDGEALLYTTIREAGVGAILLARLKVEQGKITEIETEVSRNPAAAANLEKMGGPRKAFLEDVPEAERASREDLVHIANMYFSGLERNDGKGDYPFAEDCDRIENGTHTTNNKNFVTGSLSGGSNTPSGFNPQSTAPINPAAMGCLEQFRTGYFHFVTRIRDRRWLVVDRQKGLAFAFVFFDHAAGNARTFHLADGREITTGPARPWTWEIGEIFKVRGNKIHEVEAVLNEAPYGMESGWDASWQDGMSSRAR